MTAALWKGALIYRRKHVASCLANAITIITHEWPDVLGWNELSASLVKRKAPPWHADDAPPSAEAPDAEWTDEDDARAVSYLEREWDVTVSTALAHEAVRIVAQKQPSHPIRDWLRDLEWDKRDRVDTWLIDYCGAPDTPYVRAVSRIALIGAVARVMQPGCKLDTMVVLQGPQGAGKSSAIAALVPNDDWFTDEFDAQSKDGKLALRGVWLVEVGELAALRKAEVETIKAFLSRRVDKYRDPYGRRDNRHARQCALFGTVNPEQYLRDDTGNRRFLPVTVGTIDLAALQRDRNPLWAEAYALYGRGEPWHLTDSAIIADAQEQQEARRVVDPREDIVAKWLAGNTKDGTPRAARGVTAADVLTLALEIPKERATKPAQMDAAALLDKSGWVKCPNRHSRGDVRVWLYRPAGTACPACAERWAPGVEREIEKKDRQVVQVGHAGGITRENAVQPEHVQAGQVGQTNGAGKPAHTAPLDSPASAQVATAPPLARERGRKIITARKGHARTNGKGARSGAEEHRR